MKSTIHRLEGATPSPNPKHLSSAPSSSSSLVPLGLIFFSKWTPFFSYPTKAWLDPPPPPSSSSLATAAKSSPVIPTENSVISAAKPVFSPLTAPFPLPVSTFSLSACIYKFVYIYMCVYQCMYVVCIQNCC